MTLRAGDCLAVINNLAYACESLLADRKVSLTYETAFAILHIYGVWGRDWRPLVLCAPVAMIAPVVSLVSNILRVL